MTQDAAGAELVAALRAGAAGSWPEEAAVELLTIAAPAVWQHPDWQTACVQLDQVEVDGAGLVVAEIDWSTAVTAAHQLDVPAAQVAVVQVAAAIAAGPLGAALGALGAEDLGPVQEAVAHAVQGPPAY
jgi:hypothetical protein